MQTFYSLTHDPGVVRKPTQSEIAVIAYHLYLEQGSRDGHDLDDWLRAEQLLAEQSTEVPAPPAILPKELAANTIGQARPLDGREYPWARDERGSSDREDIRRKTTPFRPASRQPRAGQQSGKRRNRIERFAERS